MPFTSMPEAIYHAARSEYLTSSTLRQLRRQFLPYTPTHREFSPEVNADACLLGKAAHKLILEGNDAFTAEYTATKLTDKQLQKIRCMEQAVRNDPEAMSFLSDGAAEGVVREAYCGLPCQIRLDWFNRERNIIVDLKTTTRLADFMQESHYYEYPWQLAFYRAVLAKAMGRAVSDISCVLIAVESIPPYGVNVWMLRDSMLRFCQKENEQAILEWVRKRPSGNGEMFTEYHSFN